MTAPRFRPWVRAMAARDQAEESLTSTPLELLFDLCFAVAVSQAASELHHGLSHGHAAEALVAYGLVFFAVFAVGAAASTLMLISLCLPATKPAGA